MYAKKNNLLILFTGLCALLTIVLGTTYIGRLRMAYNAEGRFFDDTSGVVYEEQALLVWGSMTLLCVLFTVWGAWKIIAKGSKSE